MVEPLLPPPAPRGRPLELPRRLLVEANFHRVRSEAALATLYGACPVPASSGKTARHRLNRGGNRRANAALYRVVPVGK